jgi:hypothetical protein
MACVRFCVSGLIPRSELIGCLGTIGALSQNGKLRALEISSVDNRDD